MERLHVTRSVPRIGIFYRQLPHRGYVSVTERLGIFLGGVGKGNGGGGGGGGAAKPKSCLLVMCAVIYGRTFSKYVLIFCSEFD